MKISYRTFPMLHGLETSSFSLLNGDKIETWDSFQKIAKLWVTYLPNFRKNIQIVSKPFLNSVVENMDKLEPLLGETIDKTQSGTFMYKIDGGDSITRCYYINNNDNDDYFVLFIEFINDCLFRVFFVNKKERIRFLSSHLDEMYDEKFGEIDREWYHNKENRELLTLLSFIEHCDTELKVIESGKKHIINNNKHINDTKIDVSILDATWFTNIVRSEGFNVKGHFRFQPCGEGRKKRKLVWIKDFEKNGYTRIAKKNIRAA